MKNGNKTITVQREGLEKLLRVIFRRHNEALQNKGSGYGRYHEGQYAAYYDVIRNIKAMAAIFGCRVIIDFDHRAYIEWDEEKWEDAE